MLKSVYLWIGVGVFLFLGVMLFALFVFWLVFVNLPMSIEPMDLEDEKIWSETQRASKARPPQWFSDGDRIAFSHGGGVYVIDTAGSDLKLIDGGGSGLDLAYAPKISPDESRITYVAYRQSTDSESWEIMTTKLDGSDKQQLTENNRMELHPIWTTDGSRIVFMYLYSYVPDDVYEEAGIYEMAMNGSDVREVARFVDIDQVQDDGIGVSGSKDLSPILSPDGSRIAFVAEESRPGSPLQVIYVTGVDGSDVTRLAEETGPPAWSPDSRRIAYINWKTYSPSDGLVGLFTINSDGTDPREIIKVPRQEFWRNAPISWSPDGTAIMLAGNVIEADGSSIMRISGLYSHGSWSPDGLRIAVHDSYVPNVVLYTVARDGSDARFLVAKAADGSLVAANGRPLR